MVENVNFAELKKSFMEGTEIDVVLFLNGV